MTERPEQAATAAAAADGGVEAVFMGAGLERAVVAALELKDRERVRDLVADLHPSDMADLFERLHPDQRSALLDIVRDDFDPEILTELDETVRDQLIDELGVETLAEALAELEADDAVLIVEELDEDEQREVLDAIPAEERALIEEGLSYPEDSAGRMMQRALVAVPSYWTVGETLDYLRRQADQDEDALPEDFYEIFLIDPRHQPVGTVRLSRAMRTKRPVKVSDIMDPDLTVIPATMDQEEVAHLFRQRDLVSAPVVDGAGRLVGVVTIDDVVDVIDEEHEEDIMLLGGISEGDLHVPMFNTSWRRLRWLSVTMVNTLVASFVISRFEATIEEIVALAILMPIVAAMGGNAGMQVVTVTVRALATRELGTHNFRRMVGKEILVALTNGLALGLVMGGVAMFWFDSPPLGAVLMAAMVFNIMWAGMAGTLIPISLARAGVDPALAAGPFLTTTTDVLGFLAFLGLATLVLL